MVLVYLPREGIFTSHKLAGACGATRELASRAGIFTSNKLARGPVVLRVNLPRKGARVRPPHGRVLTRVRTRYDRQTYMQYLHDVEIYHKVLHKKYVIKNEKYVMISKKVWKVCHDIKKVTMLTDMS